MKRHFQCHPVLLLLLGSACAPLCFDYHRNFGVDIRVIRIFNTYGPEMDQFDGRVISNFINQAICNNDITIYGDGSQTRSFQYVSDLINGMCKVMSVDFIEPINIGNPDEYTIKEVADAIIRKIRWCSSKVIHMNLPMDDPKRRKPNIDLMMKMYNWKPTVDLELGISNTISYFENKAYPG